MAYGVLEIKQQIKGEQKQNPGWTFLTDNGLNPFPYEEFSKYKSLSDIPSPDESVKKSQKKIILEKFGLERRAEELLESCRMIVQEKEGNI